MGKMITIMRAALLALCLPTPVISEPADDLVTTFATCTGRFSALMEHQWLMGDARADATQRQRARMETLLFSIMPQDRARQTLARRIEAKFALSTLLTRASFNRDKRDAARATNRMEVQIASCNALLLG